MSEQAGTAVSEETLEWLLAGDPAIRWQTKRDLLDAPGPEVEAPEACVTSMYVSLARYFGYDDLRVDAAIGWLLANQLDDGGWNCRTVRFGDRHSSFHTSILALEALTEIDATDRGRTDIGAALASGRQFFLNHHVYRSHRDGTTVSPAFTKLSFPPRWHYDLLRGLDHFQNTAAPWDDRYADPLDVLASRRRVDGTWPVQNKHTGQVWFDMETTGGPSRWNTLRALRVQKWARHATQTAGPTALSNPASRTSSPTDLGSYRITR